MVGEANVLEKLLGPVHANVALLPLVALSVIWLPEQTGLLLDTPGAEGTAYTLTVTAVRSLSQPFIVWLTHQVNVPAIVVLGIGAVLEPVPPVCEVYQSRFVPVAVKAEDAWPTQ